MFAYLRAFATTSLKLAVRNASFASAPFFRSRFNLISPFLSLYCFLVNLTAAFSPDSIFWANSTSCSAVKRSKFPIAVRYWLTKSVVSFPLSSASFLTNDFAFSLASASCSGVNESSSAASSASIFEALGLDGIVFVTIVLTFKFNF